MTYSIMLTILLVEDDDLNQRMLNLRLTKMGFNVIVAGDGKEAINSALNHTPDAILMDMDLPVLNGWDATGILKADTKTASIPIIAVTANAMKGDKEKALAAGCDEYEPKPINYDTLLEKITRLTAKK